jgi:hypothetical protein
MCIVEHGPNFYHCGKEFLGFLAKIAFGRKCKQLGGKACLFTQHLEASIAHSYLKHILLTGVYKKHYTEVHRYFLVVP